LSIEKRKGAALRPKRATGARTPQHLLGHVAPL